MDAKRVRGGLLAAGAAFVAVLVVALLLFFVSGDEADLSYRSVDFDAQLQSNGDIRFTELWVSQRSTVQIHAPAYSKFSGVTHDVS